MRRSIFGVFVSLLLVGTQLDSADAGRGWCRSDPIIRVGNTVVQIWIAIPEEEQASVTGPIDILITVPEGTPREVLYTDPGFNGYGERLAWIERGPMPTDGTLPISAAVSVPIAGGDDVPMQVELVPEVGGTVYVGGQTVGVTVTLTLSGPEIANTSVVGTSVTNLSVASSNSESGIEAEALGGSSTETGGEAPPPSPSPETASTEAIPAPEAVDETGAPDATPAVEAATTANIGTPDSGVERPVDAAAETTPVAEAAIGGPIKTTTKSSEAVISADPLTLEPTSSEDA